MKERVRERERTSECMCVCARKIVEEKKEKYTFERIGEIKSKGELKRL
jgi:hypothetical protein